MSSSRQPVLPQLASRSFHIRGPRRFRIAAWVAFATAVVVLILALVMPYWLPHTIRMVVPDRYIVAYAPKFIQDVIYTHYGDNGMSDFAPTGSAADSARLQELLADKGQATPTANAVAQTAEPSATPTITPTPFPPSPASYSVDPSRLKETYQGWNNCGPATLTMYLNFWGIPTRQDDVAGFAKPNPEDRNVRPDELAAYVQSVGYNMLVRVDGTQDLLKRLISHGYPVMIEQGFEVPNVPGWMGHYVLLYSYSDAKGSFKAMDSYEGPDYVYTYDHLQTYWRHFNRTYLVAYRPDQADEVAGLIGPDVNDTTMYQNAVDVAKNDVTQSPDDMFGWFNLGSSLVGLGDYENAAAAFDAAFNTGKMPQRMLWYQFGPFIAYLHVGRNKDVISLADDVLSRPAWENPYSEEAYYYKGLAYAAEGDTYNARRQLQLALLYNKHFKAAQDEINKLAQ